MPQFRIVGSLDPSLGREQAGYIERHVLETAQIAARGGERLRE